MAEQGDGAVRFLCGSLYDETFTGTSGEIATLKVNIEGMAAGDYPVTLKAVKLSETDISKFYTADEVVTTFTVSYASAIGSLQDGREQARPLYDLQGRKVNGAKKGLYICDGKKVVIAK